MTRDQEMSTLRAKVKNKAAARKDRSKDLPERIGEGRHLVFVYGTLKKKGRLNQYLSDSMYLGRAVSKEKNLKMFYSGECGGFPIVRPNGDGAIFGQIYSVDTAILSTLDAIEGNGSMYHRNTKDFYLFDQPKVKKGKREVHDMLSCFIYIGDKETWKLREDVVGNTCPSTFKQVIQSTHGKTTINHKLYTYPESA